MQSALFNEPVQWLNITSELIDGFYIPGLATQAFPTHYSHLVLVILLALITAIQYLTLANLTLPNP